MKKIIKYFILIIFVLNIFAPIYVAQAAETDKNASWRQIFPKCIQEQMEAKSGAAFSAECDDVGVFIQLAINVGAYLFTFIGALALLVFVYGGFKMIISAGDSAKIKEGKDAMVAAVIGIVIAFSGVAIVKFLGDSLHLSEAYRLKEVSLGTCVFSPSPAPGGVKSPLNKVPKSTCDERKGEWTKDKKN